MKNKAPLFIAASILLTSLASPVVKMLVQQGGKVGLSRPGAISYCNLLFLGNLCAGLIVLLAFGSGG